FFFSTLVFIFFFFFFFSSRRRHTRFSRDWSSDVCSSDLNFPEVALPAQKGTHRILHVHRNVPGVMSQINQVFADNHINVAAQYRSEERRVGKECRSRWAAEN